jgi:hypothetical protein
VQCGKVVVFMFGDLEAIWADAELQKQLLGLSLPSMDVILFIPY